MIVAIDGPSGSGKSTTAKEVARRRHLTYLDTGAMYRSVTYAALERGVDLSDELAITSLAQSISIEFEGSGDDTRVLVDGTDRTAEIRTPEIDRTVSIVSAYEGVRAAMVDEQRTLAAAGNVIAEGRDIGTVVFPHADLKIFLTADASRRAHRRAVQRSGNEATAGQEAEVLADLERRDKLDSTRAVSPLIPAADAIHLDNTDMSIDEVCDEICRLMDEVSVR